MKKRLEELEKKVEKLQKNQSELLHLINQSRRGISYYIDENGDIKSFLDD